MFRALWLSILAAIQYFRASNTAPEEQDLDRDRDAFDAELASRRMRNPGNSRPS